MDRDKALILLRAGPEGVGEWNRWYTSGRFSPYLDKADLRGADLRDANLRGVPLYDADLTNANLARADLTEANLARSKFTRGVLEHANLTGASLVEADLCGADLTRAQLIDADLTGARLWAAAIVHTNLNGANLTGADLGLAMLIRANLAEAQVNGANFHAAVLEGTVLPSDLSGALALEWVRHHGRSFIDVNSLLRLEEELPDKFLQGCGLRDEEISYFRLQVTTPIRFYSCVISYSTADEEFATRLHDDFQAAGIRCWK